MREKVTRLIYRWTQKPNFTKTSEQLDSRGPFEKRSQRPQFSVPLQLSNRVHLFGHFSKRILLYARNDILELICRISHMETQKVASEYFALANLVPELIGHVLSFANGLHLSRPLWLCGDKRLQRQLAAGVTKVDFTSAADYELCRFPLFLRELRHLREVTICRFGSCLLYSDMTFGTVFRLAPTLRKLELDYDESYKAVLPTRTRNLSSLFAEDGDEVDLEPTKQPSKQHRLKDAFPLLEELKIVGKNDWTAEDLDDLPSSLTVLSTVIQESKDEFIELVKAIPPQMLKILFEKVPLDGDSFLDLLTLHKSLTMTGFGYGYDPFSTEEQIAKLPRSLTALNSVWRDGIVNAQLSKAAFLNLPPSLTALGDILIVDEEEDFPTHHLRNLKILGSSSLCPKIGLSSIRSLPASLKSLYCVSHLDGCSESDWPPNLSLLSWIPAQSISFSSFSLPSTLTSFISTNQFCTLSISSFSLLPRTLTHLECIGDDSFAIGEVSSTAGGKSHPMGFNLPPKLETFRLLKASATATPWTQFDVTHVTVAQAAYVHHKDEWKSLYNTSQREPLGPDHSVPFDPQSPAHFESLDHPKLKTSFPFHCIPESIRTLLIDCMLPASQLVHLPSRLTSLNVKDIIEDEGFQDSPEIQEKIAQLLQIGASLDIKENTSNLDAQPSSSSPQSHQSFSVASLLPRTLKYLDSWSGAMWKSFDWPRVPPSIEKLGCSASKRFIPADLFLVARFPRLGMISFPMVDFTDEIMKAMPRSLWSIHCSNILMSRTGLSYDGIFHCPPRLYLGSFSNKLKSMHDELDRQRQAAMESSDVERIKRLFPEGYFDRLEG